MKNENGNCSGNWEDFPKDKTPDIRIRTTRITEAN